ncbi:MAG: glycoside hydrolase family 28 protein [Bacteroidota bacterium]|nr:glycoside hydrolase family 28 protein [Bacteroidota bacterium]
MSLHYVSRLSAIIVLVLLLPVKAFSNPDAPKSRIAKRDSILKKINPPAIPAYSISIISFGAKGDSITNCKPAFDKALRIAKKRKGLKIVVPAGIYFVDGPLQLVSNVCIELQKGARLKFSTNPASYLPVVSTSWEGTFLYNYSPFIYGYQLENISITGQGTIDGNASQTFNKWKDLQEKDQMLSRDMNHNNDAFKKRLFGKNHYLRPQLIQLFECKNILIEGVKIINSPFWCIHLLKSENATIRGISYDAKNLNNDGVDPEYSKNILIEDVDFNNGDDNVAIKSGRDHEGRSTAIPSENIIIRNCRFKGLHGVVIGSEMSGGVRNVFIENCTYGGYCKRGIYLKSNPDRGGFITNIYVNNVSFDKVEDCFFITSYYHGEGKGFATDIHNVFVDGLKCRQATNAGLVVQGFPGKKVRDIYFSNVTIDSAPIGVSFTNTENIVMNDVTIGGEMKEPSAAK